MNFVTRLRQELRNCGYRAADGLTLSLAQLDAVVGRALR